MHPSAWLTLLLALACAGPSQAPEPITPPLSVPPITTTAPETAPEPPPTPETPSGPDWIEAAVAEALEWEVMPGTTEEADDGTRAAALRTFFAAHPEYADPERRAPLQNHACGIGTEGAHAFLSTPPKREPVVVEVTGADWKVMVSHADNHCTSDDWGWYTSEAAQAAMARGAVVGHGQPTNHEVIVRGGGVELARAPLSGQGWLLLRAGRDPLQLPYDPDFEGTLSGYLGEKAP